MKKIMLTILTCVFLVSSLLPAQTESADESYIKAMQAKDMAEKVKLLKEYLSTYEGQGTKYENFVYANLCLIPYSGKTPQETISYGEKALAAGGLDPLTKASVLITISGLYNTLGQNLDKSKRYALQAVEIGQTNKNVESATTTPAQWNRIIGLGYYTLAQAQVKQNDNTNAVSAYLNSYGILKDINIIKEIQKLGKTLYDNKSYSDSEKAFKVCVDVLKDYASYAYYAKSLYRNKKIDAALKNFKIAYQKQKSGEIAYNIGIIYASQAQNNKEVTNEAIKYLLEASFLSETYSEKAMKMAESLYFNQDPEYNEKVKEIKAGQKKLDELYETFNKKFGEKEENELSTREKMDLRTLNSEIEAQKSIIESLQEEQKEILEKFSGLLESTKKRLGIK
ncbi:MAG: hypothetical protein JXB26_07550 [Candidatus Aminicenantes bacterium]|nr:hypothetical protein [Candidatus Aminicenantes bacterium]